jgi:nicotinamide riboside kinase
LDVDVPWIKDGTRDFPVGREAHLLRIQNELKHWNIPHVLISGDYNERFDKVVKEVEKMRYLY